MLGWDTGITAGLRASRETDLQVRMDERHRISRELHDGTSQLLVALQLNVMVLKQHAGEPGWMSGLQCASLLDEIDDTIAKLHEEVRTVAAVSPKPLLQFETLPSAIRVMAETFGRIGQMAITVDIDDKFAAQSAAVEAAIYRITQEALANARRHGRATQVWIRLRSDPSGFSLIIEDNGVGIGADAKPGTGLSNIGNRVAELGGTLSIMPAASGTRLHISMREPRRAGKASSRRIYPDGYRPARQSNCQH